MWKDNAVMKFEWIKIEGWWGSHLIRLVSQSNRQKYLSLSRSKNR